MRDVSRRLSPEATYYWQCHEPRFRYLLGLLARVPLPERVDRVLDVGMSFQTLLLRQVYPQGRIDVLDLAFDGRFDPGPPSAFSSGNLNDRRLLDAPPLAEADSGYDLVVCMEVIEHLHTPPEAVLRYLGGRLRPGGLLIVTTPNAAWLKNRLKLARGKNPFEMWPADLARMGHVREFTQAELRRAFAATGLTRVLEERRGLYRFNNAKDRWYSRFALLHPSLRRTLIAVYRRPLVPS